MTVTFVQVPFAAMYLQLVIIVPCVGSSHSDRLLSVNVVFMYEYLGSVVRSTSSVLSSR